jgi:hypothetical protein
MVIVVQKAIDALESEIGHGQVIAIGIDQRKTDPATPGFSNGSNLGFIRPVSRFSSFQDHGAVRRLSSVFRGGSFLVYCGIGYLCCYQAAVSCLVTYVDFLFQTLKCGFPIHSQQ